MRFEVEVEIEVEVRVVQRVKVSAQRGSSISDGQRLNDNNDWTGSCIYPTHAQRDKEGTVDAAVTLQLENE